ncbi:MAG: hypothetical protein ACLRPW_06435 [Intestinibacter sp.]
MGEIYEHIEFRGKDKNSERKKYDLKGVAGDRITAAQISHIERDKSLTSYELLEYLSEARCQYRLSFRDKRNAI